MHGQALIFQHFTGQDQMFIFRNHALDPTGPRFTPHCDKAKRLLADAQVLMVHPTPRLGAHSLHPFQFWWVKERLCGPATAAVILDVLLPFVVVQRSGQSRANVPFDEVAVAVVPFGPLAGSAVLSECLMPQQQADGKSEKTPESSHYPADLGWNKDFKVITAWTKTLYYCARLPLGRILLFLFLSFMTRKKVKSCIRVSYDAARPCVCEGVFLDMKEGEVVENSCLISSLPYFSRGGGSWELQVSWKIRLWNLSSVL